jgi:hypothetical protein
MYRLIGTSQVSQGPDPGNSHVQVAAAITVKRPW